MFSVCVYASAGKENPESYNFTEISKCLHYTKLASIASWEAAAPIAADCVDSGVRLGGVYRPSATQNVENIECS
jgi:hypothetical protein